MLDAVAPSDMFRTIMALGEALVAYWTFPLYQWPINYLNRYTFILTDLFQMNRVNMFLQIIFAIGFCKDLLGVTVGR